MRQIENLFVQACRIGIGLAFATLIASVLIQVVGRSIGSSPIWTEELTRYALLYLCAFGAGLALRSGDLVNVDVLCENTPGFWPRRLRLISAVLTSFLSAWLLLPAWKFVSIGAFQTSPAMSLRMTYVHFSVFLLLATLFVFSFLRVVFMLFGDDSGLAINRQNKD
ncbi:MAG: TRAP transporter small permease [Granulosicoccus sp.]